MRGDAQGMADYLARRAGDRFIWGAVDCATFVADYYVAACGVDPAARIRGQYRTARGFRRMIARAGGFEKLAHDCLTGAGFEACADDFADVVLVQSLPAMPAHLALRGPGGMFHAMAEIGLCAGRWPVLAGWRLR